MNPIIDLAIASIDIDNTITFSFTKPTGSIGGYYLYKSYDAITYTFVAARIDSVNLKEAAVSTYDAVGITYFVYDCEKTVDFGRQVYFKMVAVSTIWEFSIDSNIINTYTYPSEASNAFITYDGYDIGITWDAAVTTLGANTELLGYKVYVDTLTKFQATTLTDDVLYSTAFTLGEFVWVRNIYKNSYFFGEVTTAGEFDLASNIIEGASDVIYSDNVSSYACYIEDDTVTYKDLVTSTGYVDTVFNTNTAYLYKIASYSTGDREGNHILYPVFTYDLEQVTPTLREVENSSTDLINNTYWLRLKQVLIDKNYYDKNIYTIPYAKNESFNMVGYVGVSNCNLDIFINDIIYTTVVTDAYGAFEFDFDYGLSTTYLKFQARDKYNIKFSGSSFPYKVRALRIYSWYSLLGKTYKDFYDTLVSFKSDLVIEDSSYESFEDLYSPLVGLYKVGDENFTLFKTLAAKVFKAFEYVSYQKGLTEMLDAFTANMSELSNYEVYYNNSLYKSIKTSKSFILEGYNTSTGTANGLDRGIYYYAITKYNNLGEESTPTTLTIDCRWWPIGYKGFNVLLWDLDDPTYAYKIYKSSDSGITYDYLATATLPVYIDIGLLDTDTSIQPPAYNFTTLDAVSNFYPYLDTKLTGVYSKKKQVNGMVIVLYCTASDTIPLYQIDRIEELLGKFIAPEIVYTVIVSSDISSEILDIYKYLRFLPALEEYDTDSLKDHLNTTYDDVILDMYFVNTDMTPLPIGDFFLDGTFFLDGDFLLDGIITITDIPYIILNIDSSIDSEDLNYITRIMEFLECYNIKYIMTIV